MLTHTHGTPKYFAQTTWRNEGKRFGILSNDFQYHTAVIGKTGSGKSNVLTSFMRHDLNAGSGFCLIDAHGDLVNEIVSHIPQERKHDIIYLDTTDPNMSIGYNPLKKVSYEKRSLVASGLLEVFENIGGVNGWGAKLSHILRNCLLCLLDQPHTVTMSDILKLLRDRRYRQVCTKNIINHEVRDFFEKEFKEYNPKFDFTPIYNKIGGFLAHPVAKRIFVDNEDTLSLRSVMDSHKVLLISVPKGGIGSDTSKLIGSLLLTALSSAGFSRIDTPKEERVPFTLYVDEAQVYANTSNVSGMLEELRKMNLRLCLAFQHLSQLENGVRDSLFANIGNLICFRTSAKDADYLVREMYEDLTPFTIGDFVTLPRYHIIIKMMIRGEPSKPFTAVTIQI